MSLVAYRLPRDILPQRYDIDIDASPRRRTFRGKLTLFARVAQPTAVVTLHARGLTLSAITARMAGRAVRARCRLDAEKEIALLEFAAPLPRGKLVLELRFAGRLNDNMHGLYLAQDGSERAIVSQCEATDARAIFPCFDEPELKARFAWTVTTDVGMNVICNGALLSRKRRGKGERHVFRPTPPISTYLAALAIGSFEATKTQRIAGTPTRILCGPGRLAQTAFAADVTAHVLPWLRDYFAHRHAYAKLDQVAVPGFDAGAMENVGAIFYRQQLLLSDSETASWQSRKHIAEVIAHEIAHQWFGNLVTMRWWDDLWLNEAFATWIAYKAVDAWQPSWRMWDDFLDGQQAALNADALVSTHPIYTPVATPAQATELFDVITYEKGCAVLRMAEQYLGQERFRDGIRLYIDRHKGGNAAGADLWDALATASHEPVDRLMRSWIEQPGFPLVTVSAGEHESRMVLHVSQQRFYTSATRMSAPHDQSWRIPLVLRYDAGNGPQTHRALLQEHEQSISLPPGGSIRWVYPNADASGFYRVRLDDTLLRAVLERGLASLSPAERTALVTDEWALVRAGASPIDRFLDVLVALRGERDHLVLRTIESLTTTLFEQIATAQQIPALCALTRWLTQPSYDVLGWDGLPDEPAERAASRAIVLRIRGETGRDPDVLSEARRRGEREMHDPKSVEANIAAAVVRLAALGGDARQLKHYVEAYQRRRADGLSPETQGRYLQALSAFESKATVARVLSHCLDGVVPQEQLRSVLVSLLARRATQQPTWTFIKKSWRTLGPRVGTMGLARLVEATGALPAERHDDVKRFFAKHAVPAAERALAKALEAMSLRGELISREGARLGAWLEQHGEPIA